MVLKILSSGPTKIAEQSLGIIVSQRVHIFCKRMMGRIKENIRKEI